MQNAMNNQHNSSAKRISTGLINIDSEVRKYVSNIALELSQEKDGVMVKTSFSRDFSKYIIEFASERTRKSAKDEMPLEQLLVLGSEKKLDVVIRGKVKVLLAKVLI